MFPLFTWTVPTLAITDKDAIQSMRKWLSQTNHTPVPITDADVISKCLLAITQDACDTNGIPVVLALSRPQRVTPGAEAWNARSPNALNPALHLAKIRRRQRVQDGFAALMALAVVGFWIVASFSAATVPMSPQRPTLRPMTSAAPSPRLRAPEMLRVDLFLLSIKENGAPAPAARGRLRRPCSPPPLAPFPDR